MTHRLAGSRRKSALTLMALVVGLGCAMPEAGAQQRRTLMDMLFGREAPRGQQMAPGGRGDAPQRVIRKKRREAGTQQRSAKRRNAATAAAGAGTGAAAAAAAAPVEKSETARVVLVVGDFMAGSLASGLENAVENNREIRVVARANGSSGLVRDDHYDWPASVSALVEETKAAAVVVMLGANDRQGLRESGETLALRSEAWTARYAERAQALADAVRARNVPLIWVGMPAFQSDRASEDMVFLNDVFRAAALRSGGEYVDVWGGFTDSGGAYTTSGPDTAGQTVRLRNSDGITLTPAGGDKLAYFAEKPITRALGLSVDDLVATLGPQQLGAGELPPSGGAAASLAVSTPPVSLADPRLDGGDQLLGATGPATPREGAQVGSPRDQLVVEGGALAASEGRADDFSWTGRGAAVSPQTQGNAVVARGTISLDELRAGSPTLPDALGVPAPVAPASEDTVLEGAPPARPGR